MPKRSLMLAGGGVKIAFQAGVLQVWLDEAGIEFDHADAVSAACFNLAMWVQGLTGTQIADNWRNTDPITEVDLNWPQLVRFLYAASLFDLDAFRHRVFPAWGLDWEKIRSSKREATFNVYNFSKHELRPVTPPEMTEDFLIAAGSLPMWFPPVHIDGCTYIDAVFNTASNLEEAIRRGADELWIIWTTSQRGEWFDGFVGNFFGIFEATTNGGYKRVLARIERNNQALARGEAGEFGRPITIRELKAEVPVHYLFNFNKDRAGEAVNRGVEAARAWCDAQKIPRRPGPVYTPPKVPTHETLRFNEVLKGYVGFGVSDYQAGFDQGDKEKTSLEVQLNIHIEDVDRFITMPEHQASVEGSIVCERLGGKRPITLGTLNLLVDQADPTQKKVSYNLSFEDGSGNALTLSGMKDLEDESGAGVLHEVATVFTKISRGPGNAGAEDSTVIAMGIIRIGAIERLRQLTTFRAEAPTLAGRASAIARFGAFYFGHLWDVYARHVLAVSPF
jgi:predicted patatin/cPLA2 family phospholipase